MFQSQQPAGIGETIASRQGAGGQNRWFVLAPQRSVEMLWQVFWHGVQRGHRNGGESFFRSVGLFRAADDVGGRVRQVIPAAEHTGLPAPGQAVCSQRLPPVPL